MTLSKTKPVIGYYTRRSSTDSVEIEIDDFFSGIRSGLQWRNHVESVRAAIDNKAEYDRLKNLSPCVTIGGTFNGEKKVENLAEASGLLAADLDHLDDRTESVRFQLSQDPFVYAVFKSIGGRGLCVIFRIDPARWSDSFAGIADYMINTYGLVGKQFDPSSSNINRLRYVSYDPDIFVNEKAQVFRKYPRKEKKEAKPKNYTHTKTDLDFILQQIHARGLDITGTYNDWYRIGWALISEYGDGARGYFHEISQYHSDYNSDECEKRFNYLSRTRPDKLTIKTFYWYCKQAGLQIITPENQTTQTIAANSKKQKVSQESAVDMVKRMLPDVDQDDAKTIVEQVYASSEEFDTDESIFDQIELFLRTNYDLKYNEVRRVFETLTGEAVEDKHFYEMYIRLRKAVDDRIRYEDFYKLVHSGTVFQTYHPLKDFFNRHSHLKPSGNIDALIETIETDQETGFDMQGPILRKWLIGIIAGIFGDPTPLVPVLTGRDGTGKTEWFRRLLPMELKAYFLESKWKDDKDEEVSMCMNLISFNDEFKGNKSREMEHFKSLTSKDFYTIRLVYERKPIRLQRLAAMCGTSNTKGVIIEPEFNRRIIPINVLSIDFDAYNAIDKTALLIELYQAWKADETHHLTREEMAALKEKTESFQNKSIEQQLVEQYLSVPAEGGGETVTFLSTTEILTRLELKVGNRKLDLNKIGAALQAVGFTRANKRIGLKVKTGYAVVIEEFN